MKKELRDAWVKALRSGEYEQAHYVLRRVNDEENDLFSYCCLGVLCDVAGKKIPGGAETLDNFEQLREVRDVMELGAFDEGSASFQKRLATMNDEYELTFPAIADWIEANVPVSS